jgi:type II secretory pathway pseudopilin PulG
LAIPFILIIAAIAIPNLLRARMAANEASAVGSLRTINTAEVTYASEFNKGFAPELENLGGSNCSKSGTPEQACMIDSGLARGQKSGYRFTYRAESSNQDGNIDKYFVLAEPITPNSSGRSTFCSDESGVIRKEPSGRECTAESEALY